MTVRVRVAPSPTGNLHIGTARTALFNWLYARHCGGTFILRIEDTDIERSRSEYTDSITTGLQWLGLNWDEGPLFQTQRTHLYQQAILSLLDKGLAYKCYCKTEELEQMREEQKARNLPPRYDNRHRHLTAQQQADYEAQGRKPVIRFMIDDNREIFWQDMIRGKVSWQGKDLGGDMVIARVADAPDQKFGQPLYNLAVVVDDIDMNITHVIRGEDHIANTAKQILLYEALATTVPLFAHTPLILNSEGRKLSKRDGVTSINDFQKMGFLPQAMANYMTLLGWTPPDAQEIFTLEQAAGKFSIERVNKAGAKFDWDKLNSVNSQYIRQIPAEELVDMLIPYWQEAGYEVNDRPWLIVITKLIAPSLSRLSDAPKESRLLFEEIQFSPEAITYLQQPGVKDILKEAISGITPAMELSQVQAIVQKLVKEMKLKKGFVMRSLRAGLMGELSGPDLMESWLLLNSKAQDTIRLTKALEVSNG